MKTENKIVVGQVVYVRNAYRRNDVTECTVSKIGRKYFEVKGLGYNCKFNLKTLSSVTDGNYSHKVYLNRQEIEDEKEKSRLSNILRKLFGGYGELTYTLQQMKDVLNILNYEEVPDVNIERQPNS